MSRQAPFARILVPAGAASMLCWATAAQAEDSEQPAAPPPPGKPALNAALDLEGTRATPPPLRGHFLQYGVAFTAEFATRATFCDPPDSDANCILGSGGGIAARVGWRSPGPLYLGGAYELSKQDASTLWRLPTLQQVRGEARYYFTTGQVSQPYVAGGAGLAGYGNEWTIQTWGPSLFIALGIEGQVINGPVMGVSIVYRPILLQELRNPSQASTRNRAERPSEVTHFFAIEFALEAKDRL